jgi:hypothetical protein
MSETTNAQKVALARRECLQSSLAKLRRCLEWVESSVADCKDDLQKVDRLLDDLGDLDDLDDAGMARLRAEGSELLSDTWDRLEGLRHEAELTTEAGDRAIDDLDKLLTESALE